MFLVQTGYNNKDMGVITRTTPYLKLKYNKGLIVELTFFNLKCQKINFRLNDCLMRIESTPVDQM